MKGGKRVDNCVKNEEKQPQAVESCPKCGANIAWQSKMCRDCFWIAKRQQKLSL